MRQEQQLPNMGSEIGCFWNCLFHLAISRKACLIRFKIFQIRFHEEGERKYRVLIMEISTLIKTALKKYYSILSPPGLPNDEVVHTKMSSASISIKENDVLV